MASVPIPIPLASVKALSKLASDERLINCYAEDVQGAGGPSTAIYANAGLSAFTSTPPDTCRGMLPFTNSLGTFIYSVHGQTLYRTASTGATSTPSTATVAGTKPVRMFFNNNSNPQMWIICDNSSFFLQGNTCGIINDPDLPTTLVVDGDWISGYFVLALSDGRFFFSAINDLTIAALDFAEAEANPDGLVGVRVFRQELYFFGSRTVEVWTGTGDANLPFQRLPGAVINRGCASRDTICITANGLYWMDDDFNIVRLTDGYGAETVSDRGVYDAIRSVSDKTTISSFSYVLGGHSYMVVRHSTFCWVFDETTGRWHERVTLGQATWRGNCFAQAFGNQYVGSCLEGTIWKINEEARTEGGTEIPVTIRLPRIKTFKDGATFNILDIDTDTGFGDAEASASDTIDPKMTIRWSDDGGRNWKGGIIRSLGQQGQYSKRVRVTRMGSCKSKGRIYQFEISSSVFRAVLGAAVAGQDLDL